MRKQKWHDKADELYKQGYSGRKVADILGMGKSQVNDYLRYAFRGVKGGRKAVQVSGQRGSTIKRDNGPRILVYDEAVAKGRTHLVIADTQVKPGADLTYMRALGKYIAEKRPDVIVHIGDNFDFESLSSYDRGKKSFEGRRVRADLDAGYKGLEVLGEGFSGIKGYSPEMVFTMGNHEHRIDRFAEDNPEFEGFLGTELLDLEKYGWKVSPFLKPVVIDGIHYVHYLANPFSGKPYGGSALNQLKNVGNSFVVGHKQCLDIAIRPTLDGNMQIGIINGAFYPHDEGYKGFQGNNHFRGITVLHEVKDGFGLPMFVSLEFLLDKYGE